MDHYEISGTKYVPVRVANSDLADFCSKYAVVKNGEQLVGGYSENKLVSYALTAEVNAQTNGLKYAAKSGDGYTFSEAHNAPVPVWQVRHRRLLRPDREPAQRQRCGNYGETIRVDLTGNYGELVPGCRLWSGPTTAMTAPTPMPRLPMAPSSQRTTGCTSPWASSWA